MSPIASSLCALCALAGCSKGLVGDYTGTLSETCSIVRASNEKTGADGQTTADVTGCGGGSSKDGYVLHVAKGAAKDKLEITLEDCKIVLTAKDTRASVDPDQTCSLDVEGYEGKAVVNGTLSLMTDGESLQLAIDFVAAAKGSSGAYSLEFHGKPR